MKRKSRSAAAIAGVLAGLTGAWAMDQFTRTWRKFRAESNPRDSLPLAYSQQEWDSTSRTAVRAARYLLGRELSGQGRKVGARAVHFTVGALGGALYGALFEGRSAPVSSGLLFGAALWLAGEEVAMPVLGINNPPQHYSLADHANSLGEHLAYGITTALISSWVSRALGIRRT